MGFVGFKADGSFYASVEETPDQKVNRLCETLGKLDVDRARLEKELAEARKAVKEAKKTRGQVVAEKMVKDDHYGSEAVFHPSAPGRFAYIGNRGDRRAQYVRQYIADAIDAEIAKAKAEEREAIAKYVADTVFHYSGKHPNNVLGGGVHLAHEIRNKK